MPETIDIEALYERIGRDDDLVAELLAMLVEDAERLLVDATQGARRRDWPALRDAAHGLKGAAANLGADSLSEACRELEMMAEAGEGARVSEQIARVESEVEAVQRFARELSA